MTINDPETVAELEQLYPLYEKAFISNDVDTLIAMFWDSAYVVRFGATENLHGMEEIAAFRKGRPASNLARTITRLDIATFGKDFGSITVEFERTINGLTGRGRQSQTWVRLSDGWKIVSAHVSLLS